MEKFKMAKDKIVAFIKTRRPIFWIITIAVFSVFSFLGWVYIDVTAHLKVKTEQDLPLLLYPEALKAMEKTRFPGLAKIYVRLIRKFQPSRFLYPEDIVKYANPFYYFNYLQRPAIFKVLAVDTQSQTVDVEMMLPEVFRGDQTKGALLGCDPEQTIAEEVVKIADISSENFKKMLASSSSADYLKKIEQLSQQSRTPMIISGSIAEFLSGLLTQPDKGLQLEATCQNYSCSVIGPKCRVIVFNSKVTTPSTK